MSSLKKAFNDQVNMDTAYTWNRAQILDLFTQIKTHPGTYNVESQSQANLELALNTINALIARSTPFLDQRVTLRYESATFLVETMYDIVGWLFSVSGTAPSGATRSNYYYPLFGLYYIFCQRLIGNDRKVPEMVQMTYFKHTEFDKTTYRVVLGANLDSPKTARKEVARKNRFQKLVVDGFCTNAEIDISHVPGPLGQKFGHCAETFPCLFTKSIATHADLHNAEGFAGKLHLVFTSADEPYRFDEEKMKKALVDPCQNCEILIRKAGMDLAKFKIF